MFRKCPYRYLTELVFLKNLKQDVFKKKWAAPVIFTRFKMSPKWICTSGTDTICTFTALSFIREQIFCSLFPLSGCSTLELSSDECSYDWCLLCTPMLSGRVTCFSLRTIVVFFWTEGEGEIRDHGLCHTHKLND